MIDYQYIRNYDYSGMRTAPLCIDGHTKGTDVLTHEHKGTPCTHSGIFCDFFAYETRFSSP